MAIFCLFTAAQESCARQVAYEGNNKFSQCGGGGGIADNRASTISNMPSRLANINATMNNPNNLNQNSETHQLGCGALTWGYGLPHFGVVPRVGGMDSRTLACFLEFALWPPMHQCGCGLGCVACPCRLGVCPFGPMYQPLSNAIGPCRSLSCTSVNQFPIESTPTQSSCVS